MKTPSLFFRSADDDRRRFGDDGAIGHPVAMRGAGFYGAVIAPDHGGNALRPLRREA